MHFNREMPDLEWNNTVPLAPAVIRNIDDKTWKAINGDDGGTWVPWGTIEIGGAGVVVLGDGWQLFGGLIESSDAGPVEFGGDGADDVFWYEAGHSGSSRTVLTHLTDVYSAAPATLTFDAAFACVQAREPGARFLAPLRVIGGSTVTSVKFTIRVGQTHAVIPAELPRFRVVRVDEDGNVEALASNASAGPDGWRYFAPSPTTGANWYASGAAKVFTYACDQNNRVDLERYAYFVEVIEERGAGAMTTPGNRFVSVEATCGGIVGLDGRQ